MSLHDIKLKNQVSFRHINHPTGGKCVIHGPKTLQGESVAKSETLLM